MRPLAGWRGSASSSAPQHRRRGRVGALLVGQRHRRPWPQATRSPQQLAEPVTAPRRSRAAETTSGGSSRIVAGPVALITSRCSSSARRASSTAEHAVGEVDADHQPAAADRGDARQLGEPGPQPLAQRPHALQQRRVRADLQRHQRRRCHQRAAGEGRAVIAGLEHVGQSRPGDQRADRAARRRAPWRWSSRRGPPRSARRPTACPVRPMPVWISSKISAAPVRRRPRGRRSAARRRGRGSRSRPGSARAAPRRCLRRPPRPAPPAILGHDHEPGHQRRERRLLGLLRRRRQRTVGAPVKRLLQDDDLAAAAAPGGPA